MGFVRSRAWKFNVNKTKSKTINLDMEYVTSFWAPLQCFQAGC